MSFRYLGWDAPRKNLAYLGLLPSLDGGPSMLIVHFWLFVSLWKQLPAWQGLGAKLHPPGRG